MPMGTRSKSDSRHFPIPLPISLQLASCLSLLSYLMKGIKYKIKIKKDTNYIYQRILQKYLSSLSCRKQKQVIIVFLSISVYFYLAVSASPFLLCLILMKLLTIFCQNILCLSLLHSLSTMALCRHDCSWAQAT